MSRHRGSLAELPRRDQLDRLKKIKAEYLAHFEAFAARSRKSSESGSGAPAEAVVT